MNTHTTWAALFLVTSVLVLSLVLGVQWLLRKRRKSPPAMRPLPAFQDLQDEIKRAAENGKIFHIALGSGGLSGEDAVTSLAVLQVVEALADAAIAYDIPPVVTVGDPTLLLLVQYTLRRAYERRGLAELYKPSIVRFVAPTPMAYAAGAAATVATEDVMTNVMIGHFGPEVSLIADAGARLGLSQLAAAASPGAIGALYPITNRLAIGEELYAAGAQMTTERRYLVSLTAQDILRLILAATILVAAVLALLKR
ncbi:MAG: hypothetical protein KKC18_12965 [Chloroflexi bacterium]|nr:hypothetical protein [Chloroflexota bacterium]